MLQLRLGPLAVVDRAAAEVVELQPLGGPRVLVAELVLRLDHLPVVQTELAHRLLSLPPGLGLAREAWRGAVQAQDLPQDPDHPDLLRLRDQPGLVQEKIGGSDRVTQVGILQWQPLAGCVSDSRKDLAVAQGRRHDERAAGKARGDQGAVRARPLQKTLQLHLTQVWDVVGSSTSSTDLLRKDHLFPGSCQSGEKVDGDDLVNVEISLERDGGPKADASRCRGYPLAGQSLRGMPVKID